MNKRGQSGIYVSPNNIIPNRDVPKQELYLYCYKEQNNLDGCMFLIAARNPMRAMDIVRKEWSGANDTNLDTVVGAKFVGNEGVEYSIRYFK